MSQQMLQSLVPSLLILVAFNVGTSSNATQLPERLSKTGSESWKGNEAQTPLGMDTKSLVDVDGQTIEVLPKGIKATVFIFVATDCPIANAYQPELRRIQNEFADDGIQFLMVYPSSTISTETVRQHRNDFEIEIPCVLDQTRTLARSTGVTVTPEVAVFCSGRKDPAYRGRIDDRFADYGKKRSSPTQRELVECLKAIVDDQPVSIRSEKAVGCLIEFDQDPVVDRGQKKSTSGDYDPLQVDDREVKTEDLTVEDEKRNREIPIRVYFPNEKKPQPVVLFSHGLGGSRENSKYLGEHWSKRGYVCVFLQHLGSDESVWKGKRPADIVPAMKQAANGENFRLRVEDVKAVLNQLELWNNDDSHSLHHRMDLEHIGMCGHSFGAVTTQAVSGQTFLGSANTNDSRIDAAIAFSPSIPKVGKPEETFSKVALPWLLMTGTKDDAQIVGGQDAASRLQVFPALPAGDKFELVLEGAEHSAFSDRSRRREERNENHHPAILAISTAFWDDYLKNDAKAKAWIESDSVRSVLEPKDVWQRK